MATNVVLRRACTCQTTSDFIGQSNIAGPGPFLYVIPKAASFDGLLSGDNVRAIVPWRLATPLPIRMEGDGGGSGELGLVGVETGMTAAVSAVNCDFTDDDMTGVDGGAGTAWFVTEFRRAA